MANPKFYCADISLMTFTSSLAEDPAHPLANLNSNIETDIWNSSASTNGQTLKIDAQLVGLGTTGRDYFIMANTNIINIYNAGGQVKIQSSTDSVFTSPTDVWDSAVTPPAGNPTSMVLVEFASSTRRYWRINYITLGGIIPQVGQIFMGNKFDWGFPYDFPFKDTAARYETKVKTALDGTIRTAQPYASRKIWKIQFTLISDTTATGFSTFFQTIRGRLRPFYFANTSGPIYLVHMDVDESPAEGRRYNINDFKGIQLFTQATS